MYEIVTGGIQKKDAVVRKLFSKRCHTCSSIMQNFQRQTFANNLPKLPIFFSACEVFITIYILYFFLQNKL